MINCKFEVSLGYIARCSLNKQKREKKEEEKKKKLENLMVL
jgi:hypothetical protein